MLGTKIKFLVALRKDANSDWGAEVIGAPIFSIGSTTEEALSNLKEAIEFHYEDEPLYYEIPVEPLKSGDYDDAILRLLEIEL